MAEFQYQWGDGQLTQITLPNDGENCDSKSPSGRMNNAHLEIVASAGNTSNLHDTEQYCYEAHQQLKMLRNQAQGIKDFWDQKESACASWKCDCWVGCTCGAYKWCYKNGAYCYMSETDLENAYGNWKNEPNQILASMQDIESAWQEASAQIELDGEQAMDSALLDQLIAETNQIISLTAYQNEVREVDAQTKKTQQIFAPLMIVLILLGVGFYMFKK